jgi:hypothetical protein
VSKYFFYFENIENITKKAYLHKKCIKSSIKGMKKKFRKGKNTEKLKCNQMLPLKIILSVVCTKYCFKRNINLEKYR